MIRRITHRVRPPWKPRHLFLSTLPKTGGMYMAKALSRMTGYPLHQVVPTHFMNEQDLCPQQMWWLMKPRVLWHHAKANAFNVSVIKQYGLRPIVHVRDIHDIVLSIDDYTKRDEIRGLSGPQGHIHREFETMSRDERIDYLIHIQLPWYFSYLVSWQEASEQVDVLWTSYEELFSDQRSTFRKILDHSGLCVSDDQMTQALESLSGKETNFNKGVSGRADNVLTIDQRQAIQQLADVWKLDGCLFERIGIQPHEFAQMESA